MTFSPVSLVALGVIVAALGLAWTRRLPATGLLAVACGFVFLLQQTGKTDLVLAELGLQTGGLYNGEPQAFLQLFTTAFVHANFPHLLGNIIILLALGLPFEERVGARTVVTVYLATGALASLAQVGATWGEEYPLVGASGAVFGILGAFAAAYPNLVTPLPLPLLFIMVFVRMRVWIAALVLAVSQLVNMALFGGLDNVAYVAHFGGMVAGILIGLGIIRRHAPMREPQPVDLKLLAPFATDPPTQAALSQMDANSDEPQVFQAWLDRFFRTARCPTCQHRVMPHHKGEVVCTQGHRFDVRAAKGKAQGLA